MTTSSQGAPVSQNEDGPFLRNWHKLLDNGYVPFPLPAREKKIQITGIIGHDGVDPTWEKLMVWERTARLGTDFRVTMGSNVAIRYNKGNPDTQTDGLIGLDVDDYVKDTPKGPVTKIGATTLRQLIEKYGPLPPTVRISARGVANPSGARLFRVPGGVKIRDQVDIEGLHYAHRYSVAPGSIHPDLGTPYMAIHDDGSVFDMLPHIDTIPKLPISWINGLRNTDPDIDPASKDEVKAFFQDLPGGAMCIRMRDSLHRILLELQNGSGYGGRHGTARDGVLTLLRKAHQEHTGIDDALAELESEFMHIRRMDGLSDRAAQAEWERFRESSSGYSRAVSLILATSTPVSERGCHCNRLAAQEYATDEVCNLALRMMRGDEEALKDMATEAEYASFLASYTSYNEPYTLGRRLAWISNDGLDGMRHVVCMVSEVLHRCYTAERAHQALWVMCLELEITTPNAPQTLLRAALGAILSHKAASNV